MMASNEEHGNASRVTPEQRQIMLTFMKKHTNFAKGKFASIDGAKQKAKLLAELTDLLNAVGNGATKSGEKWSKCWTDWKSDCKKKAAKIKRHAEGTGGGPPCKVFMTPVEEEVLQILGGDVAVGGEKVADPLIYQLTQQTDAITADELPEGQWFDVDVQTVHCTSTEEISAANGPINPIPDEVPQVTPPSTPPIVSDGSDSPQSSCPTEAGCSGSAPRKRKYSRVSESSMSSQDILTRNLEALQRQVNVKEEKLKLLQRKSDLKNREIIVQEKEVNQREKSHEAVLELAKAARVSAEAASESAEASRISAQAALKAADAASDSAKAATTSAELMKVMAASFIDTMKTIQEYYRNLASS